MTEALVGEALEPIEERKSYHRTNPRQRMIEEGQVLDLVVRGYTHREIAEQLGIALRTVSNRQDAALKRIVPQQVATYRDVMREQLDHLFRACVQRLEAGDATAIDQALKVLAQRAKLDAVNAPEQVEATVIHTNPQEQALKALLDEAAAAVAGAEQQMKTEASA